MDFLSIVGLLGLVVAIVGSVVYAGFVVLVLVPIALLILLRDKKEVWEADKFYRAKAEEFLQKYQGHTVEYEYMAGTCLADCRRSVRTKLIGLDKENYLLEDGYKLPFREYIHPVD